MKRNEQIVPKNESFEVWVERQGAHPGGATSVLAMNDMMENLQNYVAEK